MSEDEPEANEAGLTSEEVELMKSAMESLEEISDALNFPVDPRVIALIEIASDYLMEQIENNIRYRMEEEEVVKLSDDEEIDIIIPDGILEKLEQLSTPVEQQLLFLNDDEEIPSLPGKSLGEKMEEDIQKWFEDGMPPR